MNTVTHAGKPIRRRVPLAERVRHIIIRHYIIAVLLVKIIILFLSYIADRDKTPYNIIMNTDDPVTVV